MNGILTAGRSSSSCEGSIGEDKICGSDLTHQDDSILEKGTAVKQSTVAPPRTI